MLIPWCHKYFDAWKLFRYNVFNLNEVLLNWGRCVTPLHALIIIMFLLENNMWGLGCYNEQLSKMEEVLIMWLILFQLLSLFTNKSFLVEKWVANHL